MIVYDYYCSNLITLKIKPKIRRYTKDTHLPELHHNGQRGCQDDAQRDEEPDCEEKQVVAQVSSLTPRRGTTKLYTV